MSEYRRIDSGILRPSTAGAVTRSHGRKSMIRSLRIQAFVLAATVASLGVALADEPARPWTDSADFGLVMTTGNTQNLNIALSNKFVYTWSNADFTLDAAALRTKNTTRELVNDTAANTVVVKETDTTTAE